RLVERVVHEGAVVGAGQRQVGDANAVLVLVLEHPVDPGDDIARVAHARVVEHVDGDEARRRSRAGVPGGSAGGDARDEGAVAEPVAGRVRGRGGEGGACDDATGE